MLARIYHINAAAKHGDSARAGVQRRVVRYAVNAARQAAHHGDARIRNIAHHLFRDLNAVGRRLARADYGDRAFVVGQQIAFDIQQRRQVVDLLEARRIVGIVPGERADTAAFQRL